MWPISTRVNNPKNDDPSIVESIEKINVMPPFLGQRISPQSRSTHDATIFRLDPPCPRGGGLLPQALESGLQPLEVGRIVCDSILPPAGDLPERYLLPA